MKDNQPTLRRNIAALFNDLDPGRPDYQAEGRGHAREEIRRIWVRDIPTGLLSDGFSLAVQAIRIERLVIRLGKKSTEIVYAITSRPRATASAKKLAAFIRGHWSIENRVHYVWTFALPEPRHAARASASSMRSRISELTGP